MRNYIFVAIVILFSSTAMADCYLDGVPYPEGTSATGLTCQADGSWK
jgi:hypothetical protein